MKIAYLPICLFLNLGLTGIRFQVRVTPFKDVGVIQVIGLSRRPHADGIDDGAPIGSDKIDPARRKEAARLDGVLGSGGVAARRKGNASLQRNHLALDFRLGKYLSLCDSRHKLLGVADLALDALPDL